MALARTQLHRHLGNVLWKFKQYTGHLPSLKPQTTWPRYEVSLVNRSSISQTSTLLLPLPPDTSSQKQLAPVQHSIHPDEIKTDAVFGNSYATWKVILGPHEEFHLTQTASIQTQPRMRVSESDPDETVNTYTLSRPHINADAPEIQAITQSLKASHGTCDCILLDAINTYVISHVTYGDPISGLYNNVESLRRKIVDCGGFSSLFVSLCIACGIPARIVSGFWTDAGKNMQTLEALSMHAWAEAYLPEKGWISADPSVEQLARAHRTRRIGSLGKVGSDRIIYSYGCDIPVIIQGKEVSMDILQTPQLIPPCPEIELHYSFTTTPSPALSV